MKHRQLVYEYEIHLDTVIPLLHATSCGVLATQSTQVPRYPFASILPFVPDEWHSPIFLISGLAEHTKNLLVEHRASFLVSSPDGHNVLSGARLTLVGDVQRFEVLPELVARYLRSSTNLAFAIKLIGVSVLMAFS